VSSTNIPFSLVGKKSGSRAYYDAFDAPNPIGELSPIVSGTFNKNSVKRLNEPELTPKFASEGFRAEKPSHKALSIVSKKLSTASIYHLSLQERIGEIGNANQAVSPVPSNAINTATKSQKKTSNQKKNWFSDEIDIRDADYVEMVDELGLSKKSDRYNISKVSRTPSEAPRMASKEQNNVWITGEETPREFRKAMARDTRNLGLAERSKSSEPSAIAAISKSKRRIKSELARVKPAKEAAFDELVNTGKAVAKVAGKAGEATGKAIGAAAKATKQGIREFSEISDEIVKNPMLKAWENNIENQAAADAHGMASAGRRARNSIIVTGNNSRKRNMTAGSLVTQHDFGSRTTATRLKVIPKVVRRKGNKDVILYFLEDGRQISRAQAQRIQNGILPTNLTNNASTTNSTVNITYITTQLTKKPAKTASGLVKRSNNTTVNKPRVVSPSGLVRRHRTGA
jgi:hypothetical protein